MTNVHHRSKVADNLSGTHSSERDVLFVPAGLGLLALLAALLGRGLSTALPGAVVGLDSVVNAVLTLGAFTSQLFAIAGAVVSLRLALWLGTHRGLSFALKTTLAAASLFVCLVVFFSAQPRLFIVGPLVLGLVSFGSTGLLLWAARISARDVSARALSVLASLAALTAAFHTAARLVALDASTGGDGLQYEVARGMATVASALDAALVLATGLWLWLRAHSMTKAWSAVVLACIPALFIGSPQSGPRYLLQRIADALTSHPDPYLPLFAQWGLELVALTFSTVCLVDRGPSRLARLALAFALLGRTTSDRPLGALLLILSALCILLPLATGPISEPASVLDAGTASPPPGSLSA
jgi:hypothetical protein